HTKAYLQGVNSFLSYAFKNSAVGNKILCPCKKCVNSFWRESSDVREHLICDGFVKGYTTWNLHGETSSYMNHGNSDGVDIVEESNKEDEISELLRDLACGLDDRGDFEDNSSVVQSTEELKALQSLVEANSQELYPTCKKYTKLRFLIRLLHIKLLGGWTDKNFDLLLDLLNDALPEGSILPRNYYEAKKMIKSIGLGYISIHACSNDCILYWKENEKSDSCPKCKVSRWKSVRKSLDGKHEGSPYFPIKKRLQRLFLTSRTAKLTRWHDEERTKDGVLRHPADSPLWKDFDEKHPVFAADSSNIRLAFATDGFNPYRGMNVSYSIWPGICIPYNFPPSMCMKQSNFILTLLIPGRHAPGSDMDPLVYDLLDMFVNGVRTYDASKGEFFQLRAAVLWTITDFLGLGYASGCVTAGEAACPDCHSYTCSLRLGNGSKTCYMRHRRFLHENHPFRFDFDKFGSTELRPAPVPLSGEEILECTKDIVTVFGKDPSGKKPAGRRRKEGELLVIFKRRSIWFMLPYWKDLMMRHNFDVMHIGKNVYENFINTFLGTDGKSKDNLNSRLDLQALSIRSDLHPIELEGQFYLPPAPYSMSPQEKKLFCEILKGVFGLKSHESHIVLQHLLPLAVRKILPEIVSAAVIRVSNFFKKICSPMIRISDMENLEAEIAETLSLLETIFLPFFFDIMVHLMVHLPAQAKMAGPVYFRSMWPVE
ncbi:hypothetical protein U9M48_020459, partial [Paspalum notatum var. saurae]